MKAKNIDFSQVLSSDNSYIDNLYQTYKTEPESLDSTWKAFFEGFEYGSNGASSSDSPSHSAPLDIAKEFKVFSLIQSYRARGHLISDTNPIRPRIDRKAMLNLADYQLSEADLDQKFYISSLIGLQHASLVQILDKLNQIYCHHIGLEYMHIADTKKRRWVREEYEKKATSFSFPLEKKKVILNKLNQAVVFENFLQTKYIGQKRFSLEGGESTIPALESIIQLGSQRGAQEFVIAMAHRGRLNVLANIIGKTYEFIFKEFEKGGSSSRGEDDVKYHLGYSSVKKVESGKEVFLKIMHNPSHLEAVGVTASGYVRAQTDLMYNQDYSKIVPIFIHGDAAIAGQGIVYESAQMSKLKAYNTGGVIHFVINNQIGFTTDFTDARSSSYCTSVAKVIDAPVLHVNGDDPEAVIFACELAVEYRQKFGEDIFIDMVCYRKYGHNEGDEPKFTQPHLYGLVAKHDNPRDVYLKNLKSQNQELGRLAQEMEENFKKDLSDRFNNVKQEKLPERVQGPHKEWMNLKFSSSKDFEKSPDTKVSLQNLEEVSKAISSTPKNFKPLRKALRVLKQRQKSFDESKIDWALAEAYAFGTLLCEGHPIRFTGQDVIRGTFSQRHAMVFDETNNQAYCGLNHIKNNSQEQAQLEIHNSLLSEYGVLGYEFGYSLASPKSLNIWEAQFGDFGNGAQIMIDQFISSSEAKWKRMSGLVILLPHGYEGQGPEHSSARMERFLQMGAQENMIIANCSTPANYFHILRRQLKWEFRKPLIIFTPKSLLRHPLCVSPLEDFTNHNFEELIYEKNMDFKKIKKLVFCCGKFYFDLLERKTAINDAETALVRLEQLYPLPKNQIEELLNRSAKIEKVWAQEEPANMGALSYLKCQEQFNDFKFIARKASASPATGFLSIHQQEQDSLLDQVFERPSKPVGKKAGK